MVQKRWHIFSKMFEHYYLGLGLATRSKISEQFLWLVLAQARLAICFIGAISRDKSPRPRSRRRQRPTCSWLECLVFIQVGVVHCPEVHCDQTPHFPSFCLFIVTTLLYLVIPAWLTCSLGPSQRPPGTKKTPSLCFYLIKNSMIM